MKKFEITVTTKQGEKKVCVYVDSETALMLKDCPEEIRNIYLQDEFNDKPLSCFFYFDTHFKNSL